METYINIGKIVAAHGLNGELLVRHHLGKKESFSKIKTYFIEEQKDTFLPWFPIAEKGKNDEESLILLEGVQDRAHALMLVKKQVWIKEKDFNELVSATAPISFLGFTLYNEHKIVGEVIEVIEQPHQVLCKIMYDQKEMLIPVHPDFIEKIDKKKKHLVVSLPEGLLELYQNL
ncbi:MAG: 16S rRNA processing protein RimM [Bacteroidetes bacterium]|nr:16S rRNA processing protein RimM [Bacteroidota bacterium]